VEKAVANLPSAEDFRNSLMDAPFRGPEAALHRHASPPLDSGIPVRQKPLKRGNLGRSILRKRTEKNNNNIEFRYKNSARTRCLERGRRISFEEKTEIRLPVIPLMPQNL
jgi:hypothetical protein